MTEPASIPLPAEDASATPACSHHWVLSRPGHTSTSGVCRNCGVARDFLDTYKAPAARTKGRPARGAAAPTTKTEA